MSVVIGDTDRQIGLLAIGVRSLVAVTGWMLWATAVLRGVHTA